MSLRLGWCRAGVPLGREGTGGVREPQANTYLPSRTLFQQDGFVFRIRVAYQREPQILKEMRSPEGMISLRDTPASFRLEKDTRHLPLLTSALHGYGSSLHRCFSAPVLLSWPPVSLGVQLVNKDMSSRVRQVLESWPCHLIG